MKSVAIVGGGITGLTAAYRLHRKNIPVTVYEAAPRVGGVINTERREGFLAESGPNSLLETSPKITSLIKDLGLENRRLYSNPAGNKRYVVRGRKPVPLPGSPAAFFTTPLFSIGAKLRLVAEPFIRRSPESLEESLAQFVKRRIGAEFLDYAINPFVGGVYAGDPERLSVRQAFPKLHALEQRYGSLILGQFLGARERRRRKEVSKQSAKQLSFDEGLRVLPATLESILGDRVRLGASALRIQRHSEGWKLGVREGGKEVESGHSAILFTGSTHRLADLRITTPDPMDVGMFSEIHYPPVASVALGFRRSDVEHPLDGFGMLIPEVERFHILGSLFSSTLFPNRAPDGHVLLTNFIGGTRSPDLALLDLEEMERLILEDLGVLLGVRGKPVYRHCVVYQKAIPQYEIGYSRFKDRMSELEKRAPGFFLAGNFRNGIALSDSIVAGHDAADRIEKFLGSRENPPDSATLTDIPPTTA